MARKGSVSKRDIAPDPRYDDSGVSKFINALMYDGKKSIAEKIFYGALERIEEKTGNDPIEVFGKAVENIKPAVEVRPRRVGGATYQVPMEVDAFRRRSLAIRWLLAAARRRQGKTMRIKLSDEIMDAAEEKGGAVKRKEEIHRMADANRAFAHYRW